MVEKVVLMPITKKILFRELRLKGYDGSILVMVRKNAFHFCHIYIVRNNRAFFLGGTPLNHLRDAFSEFLKVLLALMSQHEPRDASKTHIMNVSGWLGSIHGELLDSGKWRLHFSSSRIESFPTIDLGIEDLDKWIKNIANMELMGSKDPVTDSNRLDRIEKKLWCWKRKLFGSRKWEKPDFRAFKEVRLEAINGSLIYMVGNTRYYLGTIYLSLNNRAHWLGIINLGNFKQGLHKVLNYYALHLGQFECDYQMFTSVTNYAPFLSVGIRLDSMEELKGGVFRWHFSNRGPTIFPTLDLSKEHIASWIKTLDALELNNFESHIPNSPMVRVSLWSMRVLRLLARIFQW